MYLFTLVLLAFITPTLASAAQFPKEILESVVTIDSPNGRGTGFHIKAPSGAVYILTNKHVCGLADETGHFQAIDESSVAHTVKVVNISLNDDLCITETAGGKPLKFGDEPEYKDTVRIYGHPGGGPLSLAIGGITSRNDEEFFSTAKVRPGNSGSPVLNDGERVVGIVSAYFTATYESIFIDVETIKDFVSSY